MKIHELLTESEKKGLYYYVNKRKKAGTSRPASHPKAPTAQAWKDAAKTAKKEGVAEGKVKLYTDPDYFGAEVDDAGFDSLPIVNIPADRLVGFEPDSKMNQPKSRANVEKIVAGLEKGNKLPPLLVRKYKDGYQVLDGHHRFWAYKLLGVKSIPSRIVPDEDIEEISKQGVAEGSDVEYIVVIRDQQGKRSIHISALTPTDAKEKAEAQGYRVLKVKDPREKHYFRGQGVAEGLDDLARILELSGLNLTADEQFDIIEEMVEQVALEHGVDPEVIWEDFESVDDTELFESAAWRRSAGKSKKGGLNAKGVASYRRENPGSKLQMAVTTKPSKLKPGSKAAKRRKSFCARMGGNKGPMKKPNGKPTRKALALRKWNC